MTPERWEDLLADYVVVDSDADVENSDEMSNLDEGWGDMPISSPSP
jgi:hypothetical protein